MIWWQFFLFIDDLAKHCSGRVGMVLLSQIGDSLLLLCANVVLKIHCCLVVLCIGVSSDWINFSNTIFLGGGHLCWFYWRSVVLWWV